MSCHCCRKETVMSNRNETLISFVFDRSLFSYRECQNESWTGHRCLFPTAVAGQRTPGQALGHYLNLPASVDACPAQRPCTRRKHPAHCRPACPTRRLGALRSDAPRLPLSITRASCKRAGPQRSSPLLEGLPEVSKLTEVLFPCKLSVLSRSVLLVLYNA